MVGRVVFACANCPNALSQLSRHSSCDREYSNILGVARVMSSKLLKELHTRYSMVSRIIRDAVDRHLCGL